MDNLSLGEACLAAVLGYFVAFIIIVVLIRLFIWLL